MVFVVSAWGAFYENICKRYALKSFFTEQTKKELKNIPYKIKIVTNTDSSFDKECLQKLSEEHQCSVEKIEIPSHKEPIKTLTEGHRIVLKNGEKNEQFFFIQADNIFSNNWGKLIKQAIHEKKRVIAPFGIRVIMEKFINKFKTISSQGIEAKELSRLSIKYLHPYCQNHDINSKSYINSGTFLLKKKGVFIKKICIKTPALHPIFLQIRDPEIGPMKSLDDCFWENHVDNVDDILFVKDTFAHCVINLSSQNDKILKAAAAKRNTFDQQEFFQKTKFFLQQGGLSKKYCRTIFQQAYSFGNKCNLSKKENLMIDKSIDEILCSF
jgi:hypothetical protein